MGAGAGQRGDRAIRQRIADEATEIVSVQRGYLDGLYRQLAKHEAAAEDAKDSATAVADDLRRARRLIAKLRAENGVLKDEKRLFIETVDATKRHISVVGNAQKKWVVSLVKTRLQKARLI